MRRDVPDVSKRIRYGAQAIAVKLVLQSFLDRRSGLHSLVENGIDIIDIDHQAHGRAAKRLRPFVAHFREFVREHNRRITDRSEEHTSELQSPMYLVCRLLLE